MRRRFVSTASWNSQRQNPARIGVPRRDLAAAAELEERETASPSKPPIAERVTRDHVAGCGKRRWGAAFTVVSCPPGQRRASNRSAKVIDQRLSDVWAQKAQTPALGAAWVRITVVG